MRRDVRRRRGWQRKHSQPTITDPAAVFRELQKREMRDLETCRLAWERGENPLALCEAVRQSNLPQWLANGLLLMLIDGVAPYSVRYRLRARLWKEHRQDVIDATRAAETAAVRAHPEWERVPDQRPTWEESFAVGNEFAAEKYSDLPKVSGPAMKRSYQRVCRGLSDPARYYRARPGMHQRLTPDCQAHTVVCAMTHQSSSITELDPYLSDPVVRRVLGISTATLWRMRKRGQFPRPTQISPGRVGTRQSVLDAWRREREAGL